MLLGGLASEEAVIASLSNSHLFDPVLYHIMQGILGL